MTKQVTLESHCEEYAVGAYSEGDNSECWYPDEENGIDVSACILELDSMALEQKLHFAHAQGGKYILEPATAEELEVYERARAVYSE